MLTFTYQSLYIFKKVFFFKCFLSFSFHFVILLYLFMQSLNIYWCYMSLSTDVTCYIDVTCLILLGFFLNICGGDLSGNFVFARCSVFSLSNKSIISFSSIFLNFFFNFQDLAKKIVAYSFIVFFFLSLILMRYLL